MTNSKRKGKTGELGIGYIGIDPGKKGGIAKLDEDGGIVLLESMPDTPHGIWKSIRNDNCEIKPYALIEHVHSMPGAGVKSMFTFGENFGFLQGCLCAGDISWELVRPQAWQRGLQIAKKANESYSQRKKRLRGIAEQVFPGARIINATADALLIAEYARRKMQGKLG